MSSRVRVATRLRPMPKSDSQASIGSARCTPSTAEVQFQEGHDEHYFTFDHVYDKDSEQTKVFEELAEPVVKNVLQGFNGTILAYGQSGSGKTHTMFGPEGGSEALLRSGERGIIPRALELLFENLTARPASEITFDVELSIIELYNEELIDLLRPSEPPAGSDDGGGGGKPELRIREDRAIGGRGIYVENVTMKSIKSAQTALDVMAMAARRKHMGGTNMNDTSSRSHTVVNVSVTVIDHVEADAKLRGQLMLVDLAGSERIAKTGATGGRLKEAQNINLSLTLLGNVIQKLTDSKSLHIPYRDSKLTRLLQDTFGGNSLTTLICTLSPMATNNNETLSTLRFAQRAKSIENKPRINKELNPDELRRALAAAEEEIIALKARIRTLEGLDSSSNPTKMPPMGFTGKSDGGNEVEEMRDAMRSLLKEMGQEREERMAAEASMDQLQRRAEYHDAQATTLTTQVSEWKAKYEKEKAACEMWMKKAQSAGKGKDSGAKAPNPPTRRSSTPSKVPVDNTKRISFRKRGTASEEQATPLASANEASGSEFNANDMTALADQVMTHENEALKQKLEASQAAEKHLKGDISSLTIQLASAKELLEQTEERAAIEIKKQDSAIAALELKLDERMAELKAAREGSSDPMARRARTAASDMEHLEEENKVLHAENRNNAERLLAFTRRMESLSRDLNAMTDQNAKLRRDIEAANIDAKLKDKLLGKQSTAARDDRSYFRKRLLECFAVEPE